MKRLIVKIQINVADLDRAKVIKEALESLADGLPETVKIDTRYDEDCILGD